VEVIDSSLENGDNDSDLETTEVPTDSVSDKEKFSDLPCDDIQSCIDWMKENKEVLTAYGYNLPEEGFDYLLSQYQDEKNIEKLQRDFDAIDYGIKVDVNGRKMSVNIMGEVHNTTIVVLPGLTCPSPVIFYKSLTEILANDYKVVTIEPFGYGVSDLTDEERTAENIVSEIHECLQALGIDQFYFIGHSIGGIYSLLYDNTYQNEVLGFIGLDNSPNNDEKFESPSYPDDLYPFAKIFSKYHLWGLLPEEYMKVFTRVNAEQEYQKYPEKELNYLIAINAYRYSNPTVLDETDHVEDIVASTKDLFFHCPLLMFTVSETQMNNENWTELHKKMINDNPNKEIIEKSDVIYLEGITHAFIHTQMKDEISKKIKEWIQ